MHPFANCCRLLSSSSAFKMVMNGKWKISQIDVEACIHTAAHIKCALRHKNNQAKMKSRLSKSRWKLARELQWDGSKAGQIQSWTKTIKGLCNPNRSICEFCNDIDWKQEKQTIERGWMDDHGNLLRSHGEQDQCVKIIVRCWAKVSRWCYSSVRAWNGQFRGMVQKDERVH